VSREIKKTEAQALAREIRKVGARAAIEIGIASGFSSSVIYAAMAEKADYPELFAYDFSEQCYFDKSRLTGQAFAEIHGSNDGYFLTTGVISADIERPHSPIDFAFIDADHRSPWAALDLMAIWPFLTPTARIALHDIEMPFITKWRDTNGARDLFRAWSGAKRRYDDSLNIGFLLNVDEDEAVASIVCALGMDWERLIKPDVLAKFDRCIDRYKPHNQEMLRNVINRRQHSAAAKTVRPVTKPRAAA